MRRELEERAQALGFDLFGVAPGSEFLDVPGWVESVLVLGMPVLDPAYDLELYIDEAGAQRWSKWAYERMAAGASRLCLFLRDMGYKATPLTYEDSLSLLDLKMAAGRAGLGVRGLNNVVVTRRYGPRVRFGAVFTDLPLAPGRPLHDYYCVSCTRCISACPTSALSPDGRLDRGRCIAEFAPGREIAALQRSLDPHPTPNTRRQCTACIDACPIGKNLPTRFWLYEG